MSDLIAYTKQDKLYFSILEKVANSVEGEVIIPVEHKRVAVRLRFAIYAARNKARKNPHELYENLANYDSVSITIEEDNLVLRRADKGKVMEDLIKAAGDLTPEDGKLNKDFEKKDPITESGNAFFLRMQEEEREKEAREKGNPYYTREE